MHTYAAIAGTVHELTHIIQALNNNNPPTQYNEILSIFAELVALDYFSIKEKNKDIFNNHLINRIINRMSKRVYSYNLFEDVDPQSAIKKYFISNYTYFIGLIYSLRLFELYKHNPKSILNDFNMVLNSELLLIV